MLKSIKCLLDKKRIVLASSSPRRKEILQILGINGEPYPSEFEENLDPAAFKTIAEYVEATALGKADDVYNKLARSSGGSDEPNNLLIIAADTVVTLDGKIYGKPIDKEDAVRTLSCLSGRCHRVYTSVILKYFGGMRKFTETANVYFGNIPKELIEFYVETGDPLDKAGSYGINGPGGALIEKIEGDYYCVMGLPLHRLCMEIHKLLTECS